MGNIEAIHITGREGQPLVAVPSARLIAGAGIEGDRYAAGAGTFSGNPGDHELTLVEMEVLEAVALEHGLTLTAAQTRRNIATRSVRLNELVGKQFRVGTALCVGTRLCEPCAYLESLLGIGGLTRILAGRGGLRAQILSDGMARPGDAVQELTEEPPDNDTGPATAESV